MGRKKGIDAAFRTFIEDVRETFSNERSKQKAYTKALYEKETRVLNRKLGL